MPTATRVAVASVGCAGLGNRVDGTLVEVLDTQDPEMAAVIVALAAQRFDSDAIDASDPPGVRGTDVAIRCGR